MDEHALPQPLSSAIFRVARLHKSLAARLLREASLRPGQELVLMTLWEQGPQRQVDLVQTLDSDAGTMARSIARLEHVGLVHRSPSPSDGRAVIVEVTAAGLALRAQVERAWAQLEHTTAGDLSAARITQILGGLADLEHNLSSPRPARHSGPDPHGADAEKSGDGDVAGDVRGRP